MNREIIGKAKTELSIAKKIKRELAKAGEERSVIEYLTSHFEPHGLGEEELARLEGLKDRYKEVSGSTSIILKEFEQMSTYLSHRLGTPYDLFEDMLAEAYPIMLNAIRRYKLYKYFDRSDLLDHFGMFMIHQLRTGLYMYFLKNKYKIAIPRRILFAAAHFHKAKSVLERYELEDEEVAEVLEGIKSIENLSLTKSEIETVKTCQERLESISNYQLKGTAKKPEGVDRILEKVFAVENMNFENIDWSDASYEPNLDRHVGIGELLNGIKEEFGEVALKYWLLKRLGFRLREIEEKIPRGITPAGVSWRIKAVESWLNKHIEDYVSGGVSDDDIQNYLEIKAAPR